MRDRLRVAVQFAALVVAVLLVALALASRPEPDFVGTCDLTGQPGCGHGDPF